MFKILVLSRHPSHKVLRSNLPKLSVRSLIRLGSTTVPTDGRSRIEINSVNSIKLSANKRLMKERFDAAKCCTANWMTAGNVNEVITAFSKKDGPLRFPVVAKHIYGSRGTGNSLLHDESELRSWAHNKDFSKYVFENYVGYLLEYRLHVTKDGCFYACRKALIKGTAKSERWRRHIDNSVWLLEANPDFHRPNSWNDIVKNCVSALKEIGADVLSFDVKVQSPLDGKGRKRDYQYFILIECNSASGFSSPTGAAISVCAQKYLDVLPKLILEKAKL